MQEEEEDYKECLSEENPGGLKPIMPHKEVVAQAKKEVLRELMDIMRRRHLSDGWYGEYYIEMCEIIRNLINK